MVAAEGGAEEGGLAQPVGPVDVGPGRDEPVDDAVEAAAAARNRPIS